MADKFQGHTHTFAQCTKYSVYVHNSDPNALSLNYKENQNTEATQP